MAKVLRDGKVVCPLCLDARGMRILYIPGQIEMYYACDVDRICIQAKDPLLGRWKKDGDENEKVECPGCNADMRVFFNSTGFMKARCPKKGCGCTVQNSNPERPNAPKKPS